MKKDIFFGIALFALTTTSQAASDARFSLMSPNSLNFAAPIVATTAGNAIPGDVAFGTIVYDNAAETFMGLTSDGDWVALSSPASSGNEVTSGGTERIERVRSTALCNSGTSCSNYTQSGSWVTSIGRLTSPVGQYTVNYAAGTWSSGGTAAIPTCVVSAVGNPGAYGVEIVSVSTTALTFQTFAGASASDAQFNVICMGPR